MDITMYFFFRGKKNILYISESCTVSFSWKHVCASTKTDTTRIFSDLMSIWAIFNYSSLKAIFLSWQHPQFSSVTQSCPTLCDPMNRSTPGLSVHHQLLEFTQTHVHQVGDAIQPSHPLSSLLLLPSIFPSIRVFSNESALHIRWAKVLEFQLQHQSLQWTPRTGKVLV